LEIDAIQSQGNLPILTLRQKDFYQLIGECIKAWATVEGQLYDICAKLLKSDHNLVSVVFFRIHSIGGRRDLTDELLTVRFPKIGGVDPPVIQAWKDIKKEIDVILPVRNSLAHHPVKMIISPGDPGTGLTHKFESSTSDKENLRGKPPRRVAEEELKPHLDQVNAITASLEQFLSGPFAQAQP
jgi:hypothetical protein